MTSRMHDRRTAKWFAHCSLAGALAACLAGCGGGGLKFYDVYGTMTLDGEPVGYAEMHIYPTSDDPNSGRTVHCKVIDGRYKAPVEVAGGPARFTIAIVDTTCLDIKDYDNMTPEEDAQFLRAEKDVFERDIEIDQNEINVSLP